MLLRISHQVNRPTDVSATEVSLPTDRRTGVDNAAEGKGIAKRDQVWRPFESHYGTSLCFKVVHLVDGRQHIRTPKHRSWYLSSISSSNPFSRLRIYTYTYTLPVFIYPHPHHEVRILLHVGFAGSLPRCHCGAGRDPGDGHDRETPGRRCLQHRRDSLRRYQTIHRRHQYVLQPLTKYSSLICCRLHGRVNHLREHCCSERHCREDLPHQHQGHYCCSQEGHHPSGCSVTIFQAFPSPDGRCSCVSGRGSAP